MNLLLGRSQEGAAFFTLIPLRIGSGVMFRLHAELELDPEEKHLLTTYKLMRVPIVLSNTLEDLKKAFRPALLLGIPAYFLFFFFIGGVFQAIPVTLVFIAVMTVIYYRVMREEILVSDLLDGGRQFRCDSVVELIHKEAYLEGICEYLRQVLESAKHWADREVIPIKPLDKEAAKQLVLKMSRA